MKATFIRDNLLRLSHYKHDKPGLALKKFPPFSVIRELVKSLSPGGDDGSSGQIVLEADRCRAPAEVCMLRCKKIWSTVKYDFKGRGQVS